MNLRAKITVYMLIGAVAFSGVVILVTSYYLNQTLEINPRHPLIKELLRRVEDNPKDKTPKEMATMMFNTATLR